MSRRGYSIFPLRGKKPLTEHGLNDATRDEETIRGWAARFPDLNWGINCGRSGIVVLDVDPRNGGLESLEKLIRDIGPEIWCTFRVRTGTGGYHLYYRAPAETIRNSAGKVGPGIDVRGEGGYVVAEGSTHPETGEPYTVDHGGR